LDLEECLSSVECGFFVLLMDEDLSITYGNSFFVENFLSKKNIKSLKNLITPFCFLDLQKKIENELKDNSKNFKYLILIPKESSYSWLDCRFSFTTDEENRKVINCICFDVTESKKNEFNLKYENDVLNLALRNTSMDVWKFDLATKSITLLSEKSKNRYSTDKIENVPSVFVEKQYIHPDSLFPFLEMHEAIQRGEPYSEADVRIKDNFGRYRWCRVKYVMLYDEETGSPVDAIGIGEDITDEKDIQLRTLMDLQYKEAIISDALCIFEVNLSRNLILKPDNRIKKYITKDISMSYVGMIKDISSEIISSEDKERFTAELSRECLIDLFKLGKNKINFEYSLGNTMDSFSWIRVCIYFILEPMQGDICAMIYVQNITDKKLKEIKLQSKAEQDSLSKLYNRIATQRKVDFLLNQKFDNCLSVLFMIDLDNFKIINDSLGHLYGDAVILEVAARLKHLFRHTDIVGRLGGDEFAVFINHVPNIEYVKNKAGQICSSINKPILFNNIPKSVGCSVGIAVTQEKISFKDLYEMADKALYKAKEKGKNRFEFYEKE